MGKGIELVDFDYYLEDVLHELGMLDSWIYNELGLVDEEGDCDEKKIKTFINQAKKKIRSKEIEAKVKIIGNYLDGIDFTDGYCTETSMGYAFSVTSFAGLWKLSYEGDVYSYFKSEEDALKFLERW